MNGTVSTSTVTGALRLMVFLPALNEQATVGQTISHIPRRMPGVGHVDVLVVDDGSTDGTVAAAKAAGARVVSHNVRRGLGAAFQTALGAALQTDADLIVSIDADGQFDPQTIPQLIEPVVAGVADFTTASRFADPALTPRMPAAKLWGNHMMARLISRLVRQRFYDVSCGMRCYNRRAAMSLNTIGSFTYTQEVFLNLAFKGLRMMEVPIRVEGVRRHGVSRVARSLWSYGFNTLWIIFRCYRDYRPMRFFGRAALMMMIPGAMLELGLLAHYLAVGHWAGMIWAGFAGATLFFLGLVLLCMGIIGDMLDRHRIYLEEMLYHVRSTQHDASRRREDS